ncbi:NAD(P)-binding protein [Rhizophagus irregularis]|uniref:NAD(P)-binding protein n=1 Tax=Rhizophagus irregularis TaxID=588596 RepID=A0A2I1G1H5_9GLOM|nr:NAD(P)-binding protein [Rhizophagus irregularis]
MLSMITSRICIRTFVTNSKVKKVVIIGGSGFIGKYTAKAFIQDADTSIELGARNSKIVNELKSLGNQILPPVSSDIISKSDILKACQGASIIVNLVGIMHERPPIYTFDNVQHLGARNVAIAAKENNAQLIHISAIGADPNSNVPYAKTKALGEIVVREICPNAIIIRPSIVFGPEDDFFNRFVKLTKYLPFMPVFSGGKTKFQPVYVWDVANAIVKSSSDPKFYGKTFELGGPNVYTYKEIIQLTLNQAGIRRPIISLPWSIGMIQGFFLEKLPPNLFTITRDQIKLLRKDNIVSNDPNILTLKDLKIDPTPAHKVLFMYLKENGVIPNKRIHRSFDRYDEKIQEVEKIRSEIPKEALEKEAEYKKLHDELDKKRKLS